MLFDRPCSFSRVSSASLCHGGLLLTCEVEGVFAYKLLLKLVFFRTGHLTATVRRGVSCDRAEELTTVLCVQHFALHEKNSAWRCLCACSPGPLYRLTLLLNSVESPLRTKQVSKRNGDPSCFVVDPPGENSTSQYNRSPSGKVPRTK